MESMFDEVRFYRLYSTGLADKAIAEKMGFSPSYIKARRQKLHLEANTLSTGILGKRIDDFLKTYRLTIIENSGKKDTDSMICLCQNCPFEDCLDCVELARQREKSAAKKAAVA